MGLSVMQSQGGRTSKSPKDSILPGPPKRREPRLYDARVAEFAPVTDLCCPRQRRPRTFGQGKIIGERNQRAIQCVRHNARCLPKHHADVRCRPACRRKSSVISCNRSLCIGKIRARSRRTSQECLVSMNPRRLNCYENASKPAIPIRHRMNPRRCGSTHRSWTVLRAADSMTPDTQERQSGSPPTE